MTSGSFRSAADLCYNDKNNYTETELLLQLSAILKSHPGVAQEKDRLDGRTLLHCAAVKGSPEFCQLLIDTNPDLLRTADNYGALPFSIACYYANVPTAKYLYDRFPESINIPASDGSYPLHLLLLSDGRPEDKIELLKFLLQHDQGAVNSTDEHGRTPLHIACERRYREITILKLVFDAYPEAVHMEDNVAVSPLNRVLDCPERVAFFERQIELERQALEDRTSDSNGELPIHRALQSRDVSVGGIKLMMGANPDSIHVANTHGQTLLHIASRSSHLDTVKYLMGSDKDLLKTNDNNNNLAIHHACLGGNFDVITFIIEQTTFGVTLENSDKQTPIELLLYESECDRNSMEYVEAVRCLFQVNPEDTLKYLTNKDKSMAGNQGQDVGGKSKR